MTKEEAVSAMKQGKKVTHRYFSSNEWITIVDGQIMDENGYTFEWSLFWSDRINKSFQDDWLLFKEESPSTEV